MVQYVVEGTHVYENEEPVIARNYLTMLALRSTHLQLSWGVIVGGCTGSIFAAIWAFVVESFHAWRRKSRLRGGPRFVVP
jgi:hypothetical protein